MTEKTSDVYVYSWNKFSEGAKNLAFGLGCKRISHHKDSSSKKNKTFRGSKERIVINWGATSVPERVLSCTIWNPPHEVLTATNKLLFFRRMSNGDNKPRIPDWTEKPEIVRSWLEDGYSVCARTLLNSHSANGLVIVDPDDIDTIPKARLYTRYIQKKAEYRVHFAFGKLIDFQQKVVPSGTQPEDWRIRNHDNGFIYARNDIEVPTDVFSQAKLCIGKLELDFGAIDLIYNAKRDQAYVLEVNTAPGLVGSTTDSYVEAFKEKLNS